jgi:hypothetical protein
MWNRASRVTVAIAFTLAVVAPAGAGEASVPTRSAFVGVEGQKVRLTARNDVRVEGTVVKADEGVLRMRGPDGGIHSFDPSDLRRVEVVERRSRLRGTGFGALTGAAVGGLLVVSSLAAQVGSTRSPDGRTCYDNLGSASPCASTRDFPAVMAGGAVLGAIIGAIWPGHHYVTVRPERLTLRVAPSRGGVAAAATVGF